jgi:hypothetical protein
MIKDGVRIAIDTRKCGIPEPVNVNFVSSVIIKIKNVFNAE